MMKWIKSIANKILPIFIIPLCCALLSTYPTYRFGYYKGYAKAKDVYGRVIDIHKNLEETSKVIIQSKESQIKLMEARIEFCEEEIAREFERAKRFILSDLKRQFLPSIENSLITPIVEICSEHDSCIVSVIKKENGPYEISHTTFK